MVCSFFKNEQNLTLELACGRGEYTLALSRSFPNRNFLGIDIKGARIWQGAKTALNEKLNNAGFLRSRIELIDRYFEKGEVDEIWITFPDPFHGKENRRLTAPRFLERYKFIMKEGGYINLKTDDEELFEYSVQVVKECPYTEIVYQNSDIYSKEQLDFQELEYKTYYEVMHLGKGKTIKYLRFKLN